MISIGQPVLAASQGTTTQAKSFKLTPDQINLIKSDPEYAKILLARSQGVSPAVIATAIAEALGADLNTKAPKIAAVMVQYIISQGVTPTTQQQAADVVSVFASMATGSQQQRNATLSAIATEVSQVVKTVGGSAGADLAKNIVGTTLTNLKFGEGADNSTLSAFADSFKTGNAATDNEISNILTQVSSGQAYNALPPTPTTLNTINNNTNNGAINTGNASKPESNATNVQG